MSLTAGRRLGSYEVLSKLGEGGMGEVYRARDTRLGRDVALKTLPADVSHDPERLARFRREAQLLATLNHPNIATVHGLEEAGGVLAIAMELVDGPTLAEMIEGSRLKAYGTDVLHIARQIVEALEAAHERGIVHRDLKPANIKIAPDGRVKVLDFGLAKAIEPASAPNASAGQAGHVTNSPTITSPAMTQRGMILGTAAYMAPEQARGKPVDKRADIWAFGCVLYEMLTGRPPFSGDTATDILGAIVHKDPDWTALPADTPPAIRRLLRRSLEKDPRQRLHDIADARLEIDAARATEEPAPARRSAAAPVVWIGVAAFAAITALAVSAIHFFERSPAATETRRLSLVMVDREGAPVSLNIGSPSVDAAGQVIAAAGHGGDGVERLFVRRMNGSEATAFAGTDGIVGPPAVSPDGVWIAFAANRQLKKIALGGGSPVSLHPLPERPLGISWAGNRSIVFAGADGVFRIPADGGTPERLTTVNTQAGEVDHRWPSVSADETILTYTVWPGSTTTARIRLRSIRSGTERTLMDGTASRITTGGLLLFLRDQALWAAPIDPETLELRREAVPVLDAVNGHLNGDGGFAISDDGVLVFRPRLNHAAPLVIADRLGRPTGEIGESFRGVHHSPPRFSPLGDAVAVCRHPEGGTDQVAIYRSGAVPVMGPPLSRFPIWTPDGTKITYAWAGAGSWDIYEMAVNGLGTPQSIVVQAGDDIPRSWSPDGQTLAFAAGEEGDRDVWLVQRGGKPKALVANPEVDEYEPAFSPDGRFIAYVSDESAGRPEVWVQEYPTPVRRQQVSTGGGRNPVWGSTSAEIYYENLDATRIVRVTRSAGQRAEVVFARPIANVEPNGLFDVSRPDGRLVLANDRGVPEGSFDVIVGWFEEMSRRLVGGK